MNISTLESILMALLVADAIALGTLVLMQHGKGADVGAAFGSGSANTVFGSAGSASFLTKATAWLAIGFFLISFGLAYTAKERAAELETIGVPQVGDLPEQPATSTSGTDSAPASEAAGTDAGSDGASSAGPGAGKDAGELTGEPERVDSNIPDVPDV